MEYKIAFNNLKGLVTGISADGRISTGEFKALKDWCQTHEKLTEVNRVFGLLHRKIQAIVADGVVSAEEIAEINAVLTKYELYFNAPENLNANLHFLQGLCYGIMADGEINKYELTMLQKWIDDNHDVKHEAPFLEIQNIISQVLEDGRIDNAEYLRLQAYFKEFIKLE